MKRSCSTYANALVRAAGSCLDDIWLADLLDADVGVLARIGRVRPADDLPLGGLVGEAIADLKFHRKDAVLW